MTFFKPLVKLIVILVTIFSTGASASLIINGSFEDNDIPYGTWRWFNSDQVNGWNGSNIEIWDNLGGESAYDGTQFVELNAHPTPSSAFSIHQDFRTVVGQTYDLSFAYQARRHNANETFLSELIALYPNSSSTVLSLLLNDHITNDWTTLNVSFVAISNSSRLKFTAITPSVYTQGNFLDDIAVTSKVSEPASLVLLCVGFSLLILRRKVME